MLEGINYKEIEVNKTVGTIGKAKTTENIFFFFFFFLVFYLGPHPQHIKVPGLGVESELQLPAYTTHSNTGDQLCLRPT